MLRALAMMLLFQAAALSMPVQPVDELIFVENTTSGMELSIFSYDSEYSYGTTLGLKRKANLKVSFSTHLLPADVDGDGIAEVVAVYRDIKGFRLEIYRYNRDKEQLVRLDTARLSGSGNWFAGDVDGDGRDELMLTRRGAAWTEVYMYEYDPEYFDGLAEKLRREDVLRYGRVVSGWFAGDVDGDGRDELILNRRGISGTILSFFVYDPGYRRDFTEKLRKAGEATHYLESWFAGDVNGDGRDELLGVESDYETRIRVTRYEPGYEYGNVRNLRELDVLRHYLITPVLLVANVDGQLRIVSRYPATERVQVPPDGALRFHVVAEHTDGTKLSYLWLFNGAAVSTLPEFNYSAAMGDGVVECRISAGRMQQILRWLVEVDAGKRQEPVKENMPPEVELLSPAEGEVVSGLVVVGWRAVDKDGDALSVVVKLRSVSGEKLLYAGADGEGSYLLNTSGLPAGVYQLRVEASDGRSSTAAEVSFNVPAPESPSGRLLVRTLPPGAKLYINGKHVGTTDIEVSLPPGRYRLRLEKPGYLSYEGVVEVQEGQSTGVDIRLVKKVWGLSPAMFFAVLLVISLPGVWLLYRLTLLVVEHLRTPREELE